MSASTAQQPGSEKSSKKAAKRGRGERARTGALVILAVLITLFAVFNVKDVKVNWIFGSGNAPLIVVIVLSLLVGIVLTYFVERTTRRRR